MGSTTTVETPGLTPEQQALTSRQIELAEFQLTELTLQREQQARFATELEPLFASQAEEARIARERADELRPVQDELLNLALEDLRRGGAATPEQIALIDEATQAGIDRGLIDVERFESQGLESLREELAPSLGLRSTDTPILDRGGRLSAEALRQRGSLTETFRSAGAQAKLNFPLAASQLLQTGVGQQQQLAEATRQFQENLRSQAFSNRLNLAGTLGGLGLGLAGVSQTNLPGAIQALRPGGSTTTTSDPFGGFTSLLGGAGGLLQGVGAVLPNGGSTGGGSGGSSGGIKSAAIQAGISAGIAALSSSSKELKTGMRDVNEDSILEGVARIPVELWRYKDGLGLNSAAPHVGVYAEDFRETFGLGDGKTLDHVDTTGILMASVKALDKKVKTLEMERDEIGTFSLRAA